MSPLLQPARTLAVLVATTALCACGGGGGGGDDGSGTPAANAGSGTTSPPSGSANSASTTSGTTGSAGTGTGTGGAPGAAVIGPAGTLQSSAASSYEPGSRGSEALTALNAARKSAGAGVLNQSPWLDVAAAAHTKYLIVNIGASGHTEQEGKLDFYETTPPRRIAKAGFAANDWTEIVTSPGTLLGTDCVRQLLSGVHHAVALLSPATHVGFGFGASFAASPLCVVDLATVSGDTYGQVGPAGALLTYPYPGQTDVDHEFDVNDDSPRLSTDLFPNASAGTPVIVSLRNADYVNLQAAGTLNATVAQFELTDQDDNRVPAHIVAAASLHGAGGVTLNADEALPGGVVVLVPQAPLIGGRNYNVRFGATLKAAGPALEKTWSFKTRR